MPTPFSLNYPAIPTAMDGGLAGLQRGYQTSDVFAQNDRARRDSDLENEVLAFKQKQQQMDEESGLLNAERMSKMANADENIKVAPKRADYSIQTMDDNLNRSKYDLAEKAIKQQYQQADIVRSFAESGAFDGPAIPPHIMFQMKEAGVKNIPANQADIKPWAQKMSLFAEKAPDALDKLEAHRLAEISKGRDRQKDIDVAHIYADAKGAAGGAGGGQPPDYLKAGLDELGRKEVLDMADVGRAKELFSEVVRREQGQQIEKAVENKAFVLLGTDSRKVFVDEYNKAFPKEPIKVDDVNKDSKPRLVAKWKAEMTEAVISDYAKQKAMNMLYGRKIYDAQGKPSTIAKAWDSYNPTAENPGPGIPTPPRTRASTSAGITASGPIREVPGAVQSNLEGPVEPPEASPATGTSLGVGTPQGGGQNTALTKAGLRTKAIAMAKQKNLTPAQTNAFLKSVGLL